MRTRILISGTDAASFLQGLITQDVHLLHSSPPLGERLGEGEIERIQNAVIYPHPTLSLKGEGFKKTLFSAMLSPQGKWAHDFFITKTAEGFALDIRSEHAEAMIKKLKIYKLRAAVTITVDASARCILLPPDAIIGTADPRDARMPRRLWLSEGEGAPENILSDDDYHHLRCALCIPEGGIDVTEHETALDASYDILNAISFTKGCYVGQEVTARMHYKAVTRKGFFAVHAAASLQGMALPCPIVYDDKIVAELRSAYGNYGIAYGRFDAVQKLLANTTPLLTGDHCVTLTIPDWQREKYARFEAESPTA